MVSIEMQIGETDFEITNDPYTGDWCLCIEVDSGGGQFWYRDAESATLAALRFADIRVDEKRIQRAPTRCDA